eukprot:TRINITY_DN75537_c0_g1_i1.p1 TRINITY_DN75537_c0_g1~~TRINITY_DN75537_c0_g1_i1.p1  ORF type:complete len:809 (+),score=99.11 TRINITY_DN75537_c0_g1_i1:34-2460(+)
MPAAPISKQAPKHGYTWTSKDRSQLHNDGWMRLEAGMPQWELVDFIERLHVRYHDRITQILDANRKDWMLADEEDSGPGSHRPGGLVASRATESLQGFGIYVYAAHPSQADDEEDEDEYSGPRWYVSCMEAAMKRYSDRGMASPPPADLQDLLWPDAWDRCRPWLTEAGWTIVPENSHPQVVHADICSYEASNPREPHQGRYHHFAWKLDRGAHCTTNVVPRGFTEGSVEAHHYEQFLEVRAPAIIFDSEMLHRGGATKAGIGWTTTLTLQICSGGGWPHLQERVSETMMWYTQPLGWVAGDAVDALADGCWKPAVVESRDQSGFYSVVFAGGDVCLRGLRDQDLRHRQAASPSHVGLAARFAVGEIVEALFDNEWYLAKVTKCNADGTFRVTWKQERSCTDGLEIADLRKCANVSAKARSCADSEGEGSNADLHKCASDSEEVKQPQKRRRCFASDDGSSVGNDSMLVLRKSLFQHGWIEFSNGLPASWKWALFDFVEHFYDLFNELVIYELDSLRDVWTPSASSRERHGAFAAAKVSERLKPYGLAIYSPGESQTQEPPFHVTGPRWYVSITRAAIKHFGVAPPPPLDLHRALFSHPADVEDELRARGLGWTLAPPGSDPQALHADLWGVKQHLRKGHTRWPHILWKRSREECCTTQFVPGAFTLGKVRDSDFTNIKQVCAPAVVLDSEMLHRGAATPNGLEGSHVPAVWKSTLSLELCSPSGWAAWEDFSTGGTVKDPTSKLDWDMLRIRQPAAGNGNGTHEGSPQHDVTGLPSSTPALPLAPWKSAAGWGDLQKELAKWELSCE